MGQFFILNDSTLLVKSSHNPGPRIKAAVTACGSVSLVSAFCQF
jgi:hypothetical protein